MGIPLGIFIFKFLNSQWLLSFVGEDVCYLNEHVKRKVCAVSIVKRTRAATVTLILCLFFCRKICISAYIQEEGKCKGLFINRC